jgi:hypothetical protein
METAIAQGFLRHLLNEEEAQTVLNCVKRKGRYLIPLEVSKILKKNIQKTVSDGEAANMLETWTEFCKTENCDQRTGCTEPEVVEKWFDYAMKNYHQAMPDVSPWDN